MSDDDYESPVLSDVSSEYRRSSSDRGQTEAILVAAEQCFSRSGYAGASMREIAEAADVSKSLLHYHFQSKEHLFVEVQIRAYERLAARVAAAVAPIPDGKDRGVAAFDALVTTLRSSNDLGVQAELWAGALSNEKLRSHVVRLRNFFRDLLVRSMREILGRDLERVGMPVEVAADLVWTVINGMGIETAFGAPPERIDNAIQAIRFLTATALAQAAPPDAAPSRAAPSKSLSSPAKRGSTKARPARAPHRRGS
jgi:AcrR family transcriptional regulator